MIVHRSLVFELDLSSTSSLVDGELDCLAASASLGLNHRSYRLRNRVRTVLGVGSVSPNTWVTVLLSDTTPPPLSPTGCVMVVESDLLLEDTGSSSLAGCELHPSAVVESTAWSIFPKLWAWSQVDLFSSSAAGLYIWSLSSSLSPESERRGRSNFRERDGLPCLSGPRTTTGILSPTFSPDSEGWVIYNSNTTINKNTVSKKSEINRGSFL